MSLTQKESYAKMVCLFLAEGLRTRRIKLDRAADIAEKVLQNINLLDSEKDFLNLVKELSKDFEELLHLEQKITDSATIQTLRNLEQKVREFVTNILSSDPNSALEILKDASQGHATEEELRQKYPKFNDYLDANR